MMRVSLDCHVPCTRAESRSVSSHRSGWTSEFYCYEWSALFAFFLFRMMTAYSVRKKIKKTGAEVGLIVNSTKRKWRDGFFSLLVVEKSLESFFAKWRVSLLCSWRVEIASFAVQLWYVKEDCVSVVMFNATVDKFITSRGFLWEVQFGESCYS